MVSFTDDVEIARESVDSMGVVTVRGVANTTSGLIRSELRSGDTLLVGRRGDATLTIEDGGLVTSADTVAVATNADASGVVNIGGTSGGFRAELDASGQSVVVGATTGGADDTGVFNINAGGLTRAATMSILDRGTTNLAGGDLVVDTLDLTGGGTFNMTAGTLSAELVDGDLAPTGGAVTPGSLEVLNTPGTTSVTGDFSPGSDAALKLDINGLGTGNFDRLAVTGNANLAGVLDVDLSFLVGRAGFSFEILTAGAVMGTFDTLLLPVIGSGLGWDVIYGPTSVVLEVIDVTELAGDYNDDGVVDSIDYAVWRENLGGNVLLPGDTTPGTVTTADYIVWRSHYGQAPATLGASRASVPEASALLLSLLGLAGAVARPRQSWLRGDRENFLCPLRRS